ncbi:ATP-binding response regulator [Raoultibacter phocaeensis]|uniref:ATP-binding response regulator n=1 Tax=Raoultibacter phocaeensis TaxID=2479841 RepID=UPI00210528D6|nr:ATP-binding protein [Raoultibacter phocaeensis]
MRSRTVKLHSNHVLFVIVSVAAIAAVLAASVVLLSSIDQKLRQGAEQQVTTFTEQAASNVKDRMGYIQNAIGAFTVETDDLAQLEPALAEFKSRFGFESVAFAGMDGIGIYSDGQPFSTAQLKVPETAISEGRHSYSGTYDVGDGLLGKLAQNPLYIQGVQVGALYVVVPSTMFSMEHSLDMFDGRGYFILFDGDTEEIIVAPSEPTVTPIESNTKIYEFLYKAQQVDQKSNPLLQSDRNAQQKSSVAKLERAVADGSCDLVTASIDGKESYVCVAPVQIGDWYVCNVVPVDNVRAEGSAVMAAFQVVFALVITCLLIVLVVSYLFYRKRMQERGVEMKTRLYGALSESLDMAVNMYSPDDATVTPIVAKASEIFGFSMAELMGKAEVFDKIALSSEGRDLLGRIRRGTIESLEQGEFSFKEPWSGRPSWVFYSVTPFTYEGKAQLLVVFRDATDEKTLQLSMSDAMVAAETANKAKSDFLSNMSHEIRTPMNAIIGMAQIARKNLGDDQKVKESLDKIDLASDHLLTIINDVLDISKIESGKMILANEVFSLSDVIDRVVAGIKGQCEARGQTLSVKRHGIDADAFMGDQVRLRQMLLNLLVNASKYTPEGGHIRFEVSEKPSNVKRYMHVTFTVADDGIGMSGEYLEHLFEPFVMEGRSTVQGTGLGMPIVKNIVTMLNGDIHVESELDKGTTFTVSLTLTRATEDEKGLLVTDAPASKIPPAGRSAESGDSARFSGLRVLLAEDNELNAEIAKELLSDAGLEVDWAENGEQACILFEQSEPGAYDVVLMDIQMPIMNGYEAARTIRSLDRGDAASVPIIAMSANAFMEDIQESLRCGMNAHLSKPIDMGQVLATIAEQIKG